MKKIIACTFWFLVFWLLGSIVAGAIVGVWTSAQVHPADVTSSHALGDEVGRAVGPYVILAALVASIAGTWRGWLPGTKRKESELLSTHVDDPRSDTLLSSTSDSAESGVVLQNVIPPDPQPLPARLFEGLADLPRYRPPDAIGPWQALGLGVLIVAMPVLVVSLAALAGGVVSALWVGIFGGTIDAIMPSTMYLGAAAAVAGYVYGAYYIAGFVRKRAPRWFEDASPIGIAWSGASVRFLIAGAVCGVLLAAGILVMSELLPPPPQQVPVAWKMLAPELQWFSVRFFVFNVVAIAPVLEEFVFRGVLVASSVRRWGLPVACIGSVLAFALMHVGYLVNWWPGFFLVSLMGATCLVLRLWSRSLGPAIACHSAYNFGLLVLSVAVLAT